MIVLLIFSILIVGMLIWSAIDNCKIELRYRNTLLEKQNEILERERK
jgi:hypothetical protein